jgi:hypothetical protein
MKSEEIMPNLKMSAILLFVALGLIHDTHRLVPSEAKHYPRLTRAELPLYPSLARTAHISGKIEVQVTVEKGSVVEAQIKSTEIEIDDPQNHAIYDSSAKKAASRYLSDPSLANIKTWQFEPEDPTTFLVTYIYEIEGEQTPLPENPKVELDLPRLVKITARPFKPTCNDCTAGSPDAMR